MSEELSTAPPQQLARRAAEPDITQLLTLATEKGVSIDVMERLMKMRSEMKAEAAKEAFADAMARFQVECPPILKTRIVKNKEDRGGGVRYKFAPLDEIIDQTRELMRDCGFTFRFNTANDKGFVSVECIVTHRDGHSETSSFSVPVDPSASKIGMNVAQATASAMSYARRYALLNAFGIQPVNEDDDANALHEDKSAKARLERFKAKKTDLKDEPPPIEHRGEHEDDPPRGPDVTHVPATFGNETTDLLLMISEAADVDTMNGLREQVMKMPKGPSKEAVINAMASRRDVLGLRFNNETRQYVKVK